MDTDCFGLTATELPLDDLSVRVPKLALLAQKPADGWFRLIESPAGIVATLFLSERADFEYAIRTLLHNGEPIEIPASMGASFISGLWDRVRIADFVAGFPTEEAGLEAVMADKASFKTCMIILSSGPYSAVSHGEVGLSAAEWLRKSLAIRLYHELAHHVCRSMYADRIDALRDEVIADMAGIIGAFGSYMPEMALRFFGVGEAADAETPFSCGTPIREGGRLLNYLQEGDDHAEAAARIKRMVTDIAQIAEARFDSGNVLEMIASPAFQEDILGV